MFRYTNPENTKEYDKANVVLHSKLATIAWPLALREKKVMKHDLPAKLHKDASRHIVTLSFEVLHCHDIARWFSHGLVCNHRVSLMWVTWTCNH